MSRTRTDPDEDSPLARWFTGEYGGRSTVSATAKLTGQLLLCSNQSKPPVSLGLIAEQRSVKQTVFSSGIRSGGRIQPVPSGFIIHLDGSIHWYRRKEVWAHEIAHTFFYDVTTNPPRRLIGHTGPEEEAICNLFARTLVAPREFLRAAITGRRPTLQELVSLGQRFEMNTASLSRRIFSDLRLWQGIFLVCEERPHLFPHSRNVNHPEVLPRVVRTIAPVSKGYYVPLNKTLMTVPVIADAFSKREFQQGLISFERFGDVHGPRFVQAMPAPAVAGEPLRVFAIIDMTDTSEPEQPASQDLSLDLEF